MAAKFLLCAVLALFAVQTLYAHPSSDKSIEDTIQEVLLKIKEALHQLTLKLEALGKAAVEKIKAAIEAIKAKGKELVDQALDQLEVIGAAIEAKIDELLKLAAENGVDITECVTAARASLAQLKQHTHDELASCVSGQVKEAQVIIEEIVSLVKLGVAEAKQTEANVEQCLSVGKPLEVLTCLKEEAQRAKAEALRLGGLIAQEVIKAEKLVAQAAHDIPACIAQKLAEAKKAAEVIVNDFKACVADKINNKP